jgi:hypothetical protein
VSYKQAAAAAADAVAAASAKQLQAFACDDISCRMYLLEHEQACA